MNFLSLLYREFKLNSAFKSTIVLQIISPLAYYFLFAASFFDVFNLTVAYNNTRVSYLLYMLPGLIALEIFNVSRTSLAKTANDRRFGMLSMILASNVSFTDYIFARITTGLVISSLQTLFLMIVGKITIGFFPEPRFFPLILIAILLGNITFSSMGIYLGLTIKTEERRDLFLALISLPLMFSSSVFYNVSKAPKYIYYMSLLNPLTYLSDALRSSFLGVASNYFLQVGILLIFAVFFTLMILIKRKNLELIPEER